ncbi:MAG: class I SAM-dependent methyltransferase [Desulfurococcaceae archaeon]
MINESFAKERQRIHLIRADSHDPKTLEFVKRILGNGKLDFLFIDGDHTYEGVKRDFEMYSPLVRKGGIIAFHDIVEHPPETGCEVSRFWNEIKHSYNYLEIVKSWDQKWAGIGVIYV